MGRLAIPATSPSISGRLKRFGGPVSALHVSVNTQESLDQNLARLVELGIIVGCGSGEDYRQVVATERFGRLVPAAGVRVS